MFVVYDGPIINVFDNIGVTCKLVNYNTLQEITNSSSHWEVNSSQFIILIVHTTFAVETLRNRKVTLTFKQYTNLNYNVVLSQSNSGYFISSNHIPLKKSVSDGLTCYEADITSLVAKNPDGTYYFAITTSSAMSFYVSGPNAPSGDLLTYTVNIGDYSPYLFNRVHQSVLRDCDICVDLFSGVPRFDFNLYSYTDELVSFNLKLCYSCNNRTKSDINTFISTHFPKGFKLSAQQYLYQSDNNCFVYIDEHYLKHTFVPMANDDGTFVYYVDTNGGYLVLKVLNSGYKIYDAVGNQKIFSSSGYLTTETIINGNNTSSISYVYSSNKLSSISVNSVTIVSISYYSSYILIEYPLVNMSSRINMNFSKKMTSLLDKEQVSYTMSYDLDDTSMVDGVYLENSKGFLISYINRKIVSTLHHMMWDTNSQDYYPYGVESFYFYPYKTVCATFDNKYVYYTFDENGEIIKKYIEKSGVIVSANEKKKHSDFECVLTNDSPNFMETIEFGNNGEDYYFYDSFNITPASNPVNCHIRPKRDGKCILCINFETLYQDNYSSYSSLAISISIEGNSNQNDYLVTSNEKLDVPPYGEAGLYMREILIPPQYFGHRINFTLTLSGGDTSVCINDVRLLKLVNPIKQIGLNIATGNGQLVTPTNDSFYVISGTTSFVINNVSYNVLINEDDIKTSMLFNSLLSLSVLFYENGTKALYGAISKGGISFSNIKLIEISSFDKLIAYDDQLEYEKQDAIISYMSIDGFVTETINRNGQTQTSSTSSKTINNRFLLLNEESTFPYANANYTITRSASYNNYGQTLSEIINYNNYFHVYGVVNTYSNDNTRLISQSVAGSKNNNIYNVSPSYQYNGHGDVSKRIIDSVVVDFNYDSNHTLQSLSSTSNNSSRQNNVSYDNEYNVIQTKNANSWITNYQYDFRNRIKQVEIEDYVISFSYTASSKQVTISGNNQTSLSEKIEYTCAGLPLEIKKNNQTVLKYYYKNKYNGFESSSSSCTGLVSKILDYSLSNNVKQRLYTYDENENISSIVENGYVVNIDSYYYSNPVYHDLSEPIIFGGNNPNKVVVFKKEYRQVGNSNTYLIEKNYFVPNCPVYHLRRYTETGNGYSVDILKTFNLQSNGGQCFQININDPGNIMVMSAITTYDYFENSLGNYLSIPCAQNTMIGNSLKTINYSYDSRGNISSIASGFGLTYSYSYNEFNELSTESNSYFGNKTYSYDNSGNITSITNVSTNETYALSYDSNNRLSLITKTTGGNSTSLSCSNYIFGRPFTYKNKTLNWDNNKLIQYGNTYFLYDGYGRRTTKYNNERTTEYLYLDNVLLQETITITSGNNTSTYILKYLYDNDNKPIGFIFNNSIYFFVKDILNNVVAVYKQNGTLECKYAYDAYGNCACLKANGNIDNNLSSVGNLNPFRYRGYYYDVETNLYYLQSRYYDPEIGRFISSDSFEYSNIRHLNGLNRYAYCYNNPITFYDIDGRLPDWFYYAIGVLSIAGSIALSVFTGGGVAPIVATSLSAITGFVFGGLNKSDSSKWDWHGAAKGFGLGGFFGLVSECISFGIGYLSTSLGLNGFSKVGFKALSEGASSLFVERFRTIITNETWSPIRALTAFGFGSFGSIIGFNSLKATFWSHAFLNFLDSSINKLYDYYELSYLGVFKC